MKFLLLTLIASCTMIRVPFSKNKESSFAPGHEIYQPQDYLAHWHHFKNFIVDSHEIKLMRLSQETHQYLSHLAQDILDKNETFFRDKKKCEINIINSSLPVHFSLPGNIIFLSTGLINKYIKHEGILASIMSYELIRSEKGLYKRTIIIPTGNMSLERMMSLNRLPSQFKIEIHKWAYHFTKRTGFDGEYYLSWLQIQNRNSSDFNLMLGDNTSISMEEAFFKNFLVKKSKQKSSDFITKKNSSKDFYKFLFYIKDKTA